MFFGESMFATAPDASKVAFVTLVGNLLAWDFRLIDCQVPTDHLARFGASSWPRAKFLRALGEALAVPSRTGRWELPLSATEALDAIESARR